MNVSKKLLVAISAVLFSLGTAMANAQVVVRIGPPPRRVERIPPPRRGWVWVGGYNRWNGRGYVWVPGQWRRPPRGGAVWVPGDWRGERGGHVWHEGYWR